VDFAYAIHTEVGHHCSGAKINGQIVPLKHVLENGDIIEVITNPHQRPNKDWLKFVKTGRAQTKIRNAIRKEQRDRSLELGRELLDKELKRHGSTLRAMEKSGKLALAAENSRFSTVEEMVVEVGYGKFPVDAILDKLFPPEVRAEPKKEVKESRLGQLWDRISGKKSSTGVLVDGIEDVMVSYARCCNPIPGDDIVGFVTRGRGLTVHAAACERVKSLEEERRVPVSWAANAQPSTAAKAAGGKKPARRPVNVRVYCTDKPGLLASISTAFTHSDVNISQAHCMTTDDHRAINTFEVLVTDLDQLTKAMRLIEKIKGVYKVERV
jgi:GTP pyrophosphokinase